MTIYPKLARTCWGVCSAILLSGAARGADTELIPADRTNLSLRNEVQRSIDVGLRWLKTQQKDGGYWSMEEHPALTALVLTAFMHEPSGRMKSENPEFLKKGYDYLLRCAQPDGGIYRDGLSNYNTSVSLTALLLWDDPEVEPVLMHARDIDVGQQAESLDNPALNGGIGYGPGGTNRQHPDLSNTLMSLEALHRSRHLVERDTPEKSEDLDWEAAIAFVQRCQNLPSHNRAEWVSDDEADKGGFVYFPGHSMAGERKLADGRTALRSYGSMSYAGLLSYIYADLEKDDPRVTAVVDWLNRNYTLEENPGMGAEGLYYYFHLLAKGLATYGAKELKLAEGTTVDWRTDLAKRLIDLQKSAGFWVNESGRWWEKDPVLVTAYSVLALEIVYRAL